MAPLLGSLFQVAKKSKEFFGVRSWGQAICDPAGRRGELRGIWEASGRHLGGIWEASGPKEAQKRISRKMCQNHCVFLSKVARATVSRARERPDPHQVRSLCIKVGERPGRGSFRHTHGYPYLAARTPTDKSVWGKKDGSLEIGMVRPNHPD